MSRKLYLECCSGISGDMTAAALLDLGADRNVLEEVLKSLPVQGFEIKLSKVKKAGLDVLDFNVILDAEHENHDHDMEYLHGHDHSGHEHTGHHHDHDSEHAKECAHDHSHEHIHECDHEHSHDHSHDHHHPHEHRGLNDVLHIIEHAKMTPNAKDIAGRIFKILGKAEAKAHGVPEDQVHFHEVGAVDSIVDIISVAVCLDNLGIEECIIPVLYEGCGTIRCQHGILPVPVPAVVNIVADNHLKLAVTGCHGEFVTPTGAAIAAAIKTSDILPETFMVQKIGMGAGKREYERPGILRAMLIETEDDPVNRDVIWKLETNMDDCTGEALGYVLERLLEEGARDVNYMPVYMKKNRPAYQLNVICNKEDIPKLERIIFEETTTIGIRRQKMQRTVLKRTMETVSTSLGEVRVKVCVLGDCRRIYPEYESVKKLCRLHGKSYQGIYQQIMGELNGGR